MSYSLDEERSRIQLTCMVSCLFARKVYSEELLQQALSSLSLKDVAENLSQRTAAVQKRRWRLKFKSGFDPSEIMIAKRFKETKTSRGRLDEVFLDNLIIFDEPIPLISNKTFQFRLRYKGRSK